MATTLGVPGTMLSSTLLGEAIRRAADSVAAFAVADECDETLAAEMATATVQLCQIVLDALEELGVTE